MIQNNQSPTLDGLFRRVLARQPDAPALVDPADKLRVTGRPPRSLSYAQADQAISALAAHFMESGLPANSVIAVQLPNTVEFVLTILAAHRAGLVVALLPQLWRRAELTVALNRTGARSIVTTSRIDGVVHADLAMHAAADAFSIRHVGGFGQDLPEGMASLDAVVAEAAASSPPAVTQDARRAAIVSFDVTSSGFRAVARTHLSLIAGGLVPFLESGVPQGASLLSTLTPASFASVASALLPWLLSGGTLVLHHPFDGDVLERQINAQACNVLVAPAALAFRLAEGGVLSTMPTLRHVMGLWRAPEQVASSTWPAGRTSLTDIYLFGEAGLFGAKREDDGVPLPIVPGPHGAPRAIAGSSIAGEILLTPKGTLGLRGPMIPVEAYAPQTPSTHLLAQPPLDYVDTGYAARIDRTGAMVITAPPSGIMAVGGYRFLSEDLLEWARRLGQGALLTALPDRLCGQRLAGRANNNARAREALAELGLNPLMVEAFRDRVTTG